jgi:hypothetical protein
MALYRYIFGYESPRQLRNNDKHGRDDEDSWGLFIDANNEAEALAWGHEVSERFLKLLFRDNTVSWRERRYASTIDPWERATSDLPSVRVNEEPDYDLWLSRHVDEV